MPRKNTHLHHKRKKKSLTVFYLVMLVSIVIGVPIALRLSVAPAATGSVEGITTASRSGELKPSPKPFIKPSVYLSTETFSRGTCFPEFQKVEYTCTDGFKDTYNPTVCVSPQMLLKTAELGCYKRGTKGTPTQFQNTKGASSTSGLNQQTKPSGLHQLPQTIN